MKKTNAVFHPGRNHGAAVKPNCRRETVLIAKFIHLYCRGKHGSNGELCVPCEELLHYAGEKLERCPYDPKPACRRCPTHCYEEKMRIRMKQVMRYSGMHFVLRGRLDWLVKYFLLTRVLDRAELRLRRKKPIKKSSSSNQHQPAPEEDAARERMEL